MLHVEHTPGVSLRRTRDRDSGPVCDLARLFSIALGRGQIRFRSEISVRRRWSALPVDSSVSIAPRTSGFRR